MFGIAFISVIAPMVTMVVMNDECFGMWLHLWSKCHQEHSFNLALNGVAGHYETKPIMTEPIKKGFSNQLTCPSGGTLISAMCLTCTSGATLIGSRCSTPVNMHRVITTHEEICQPAYVADGRCPRGLISNLGDLYARELIASASLSPLMTLLRVTPPVQMVKAWIARSVFGRHDHQEAVGIDKFVFNVVLHMEIPLVLGFCYPILVPLAALVVGLNAGVFRIAVVCLRIQLQANAIRVPARYLWGSLMVGSAIIIWLFAEANLHGKWLVIVGIPLSGALSAMACRMWHQATRFSHVASESPLWDSLLESAPEVELGDVDASPDRPASGVGE